MGINKKTFTYIDWQLVLLIICICSAGLLVLSSAGFNFKTEQSEPMKKQALAMSLGAIAFVMMMALSPVFWKRWAYVLYGIGVTLLVGVLTLGIVAGGARRWIDLGPLHLQPSETMKLFLILAMARFLSRDEAPKDGYTFLTLIKPALLILPPVVLIFLQPDLGTAGSLVLISGSMLLVAGIRKATLIFLMTFGVLMLIPGWFIIDDYQRQRVLTFMSPEADPLGTGYHALQSKIAVGSGALFGKGYMEGSQTQLRFLPEQTTDFIFSVLAEEWGFFGTAFLLSLYALLILRLISIAARSKDKFSAFVVCGVTAMIFWHLVINVGMVVGVFPVVGITLPLLSYGGSSVLSILAALGLVAGVSYRRYKFL
jgi:rod shape determining protein RodA